MKLLREAALGALAVGSGVLMLYAMQYAVLLLTALGIA